MKIFITGITGFIGSELARRLVADDKNEVFGLIKSSDENISSSIKDIMDKIQIRYGSLSKYELVTNFVKNVAPEYIVHLGAYTSVAYSNEYPLEFNQVNYLGAVNLVHAALDVPSFKKFIFASTAEVYGARPLHEQLEPFREDMPLHPTNPYGVSKMACESYIEMMHRSHDFPYLIARFSNTYGRKHNAEFITEYIAEKMISGEEVYLGTPNSIRDMMYVDDHVNAYMTMLKTSCINDTFNFGTGSKTPMKDIAEKLKILTGFTGKITHGFPPGYPKRSPVEDFLSVDASKAKEKLGWKPAYTLHQGLQKLVESMKQRSVV